MFEYLVFPVKLIPKESMIKTRDDGKDGKIIEASNYEEAHQKGGNHIPLFEGEQLAVVLIGKV